MSIILSALLIAANLGSSTSIRSNDPVVPPRSVRVLPIYLVPKDIAPPTSAQMKLYMRHVEWAQKRFRELLPGHITFGIAARKPLVYRAPETLAFYREQPEGGAPRFVSELLDHLKFTRFNCPYILLVVLMNPLTGDPAGGGRPLNGGLDTGGGIVILSSTGLEKAPNFQATLQHELGHSFGLPHVDVYGFSMSTNDSMMSYNPRHSTNFLEPSKTPGKFNPEDLRALALNQKVFPGLKFDPSRDIPANYSINPSIVALGPMILPGYMDMPRVTTDSGEADGSAAQNVLVGEAIPGDLKFDPSSMWRSAPSATGWVSLVVEFPIEVTLTSVKVHSFPKENAEATQSMKVSVCEAPGKERLLTSQKSKSMVDEIRLPKSTGKVWRFEFQVPSGGSAVIRGLEFFSGSEQLFPPLVPFTKKPS